MLGGDLLAFGRMLSREACCGDIRNHVSMGLLDLPFRVEKVTSGAGFAKGDVIGSRNSDVPDARQRHRGARG